MIERNQRKYGHLVGSARFLLGMFCGFTRAIDNAARRRRLNSPGLPEAPEDEARRVRQPLREVLASDRGNRRFSEYRISVYRERWRANRKGA